jgi:hypothetical protein
VHVEGDFDADLKATLGVHLAADQTVPLWEGGDPDAVTTPLGPQDLTFSIDAVISSDGTVGVSFGATYKQDLDEACTYNITQMGGDEDKCTGSQEDNGSSLDAMSELFGSMDEKAGVRFGVTWQFDEVAGPGFTFTPWVEATADTSLNPRLADRGTDRADGTGRETLLDRLMPAGPVPVLAELLPPLRQLSGAAGGTRRLATYIPFGTSQA